jgi:sporulation inhibitor KapD
MRAIIYRVDELEKQIWIKKRKKLIRYALSNKMAKLYMTVLSDGLLIDFELENHTNLSHKIKHINQIISLRPYRIIHDTLQLRKDMFNVINKIHNYVFIDFEMNMPAYGHKGKTFQSEIIQYGYVVTNKYFEELERGSNYVFTKSHSILSDRTLKFLKLELDTYLEHAISYHTFYDQLHYMKETYQPKFVIWGKNDLQVLNDSYKLHDKEKITHDTDFIDALKLHKDYYDLKDDLGLLAAFNTYYEPLEDQVHDALTDAMMTQQIMKAFKDMMKKGH